MSFARPRRSARRGLVALTAIVALVAAACGGDTSASPTPRPTPAGSALPAGTYTSTRFQPAVTFTLPGGWEMPTDAPNYLNLHPLGDDAVGIHLFRDPAAMSQGAACPAATEPGVGVTSLDLVKWIRERPGLVVGQPGLVTVGGLSGTAIEIGIIGGWKQSCPFANGLPTVPLIFQPTNGYQWVVVGNERLRLYVLDVPGGGTVVVDIDAFDGSRFEELLAAATPIVTSFSFARP